MRDEGNPTSVAWPVAWASNELMSSLQEAYRWANTSDHMVHANRGPMLVDRRHPETDVRQGAYFVQLTTVGSLRDLRT